MVLVYRPDWRRALQLLDGFENPQPHHLAGCIALSRKCVSPFHSLNGGGIAVAVYKQLGGRPL